MKIQSWKRLTEADLGKLPGKLGKLVDALNRFMESIVRALQANLTLADNFPEPPRKLKLKQDTVEEIELRFLKKNPVGVDVVWTSFFEYPRLAWRMHPTKPLTIQVKVKWDTEPETDPEVRLIFWAEGDR